MNKNQVAVRFKLIYSWQGMLFYSVTQSYVARHISNTAHIPSMDYAAWSFLYW